MEHPKTDPELIVEHEFYNLCFLVANIYPKINICLEIDRRRFVLIYA